MSQRCHTITIQRNGQVELPADLAARFGAVEGARILVEERDGRLILHRSVNVLERVYLEPTNACNLTCVTCMRNIWQEPPGWMSADTFERILVGLQNWNPRPIVFFGGFGEPLSHPNIFEMVARARYIGAPVELITNGILLEAPMVEKLLQAGVRTVWVSLDGVSPQSYQDIRLGGYLEPVLDNLRSFQKMRAQIPGCETTIAVSFVAMRRNIVDLPALLKLARELGVRKINVTNLLAHNPDMHAQTLYDKSQADTHLLPELELARFDPNGETLSIFHQLVKSGAQISISGASSQTARRSCPFLEKASLSIRWDGAVSPCLGLLHTHEAYLGDRLRQSHAYLVGNVNETGLHDLWMQADFVQLRERLQQFDFSPCVYCNTCEMSEQNLEDCFGNRQPACGGCLWAQGLITCP